MAARRSADRAGVRRGGALAERAVDVLTARLSADRAAGRQGHRADLLAGIATAHGCGQARRRATRALWDRPDCRGRSGARDVRPRTPARLTRRRPGRRVARRDESGFSVHAHVADDRHSGRRGLGDVVLLSAGIVATVDGHRGYRRHDRHPDSTEPGVPGRRHGSVAPGSAAVAGLGLEAWGLGPDTARDFGGSSPSPPRRA